MKEAIKNLLKSRLLEDKLIALELLKGYTMEEFESIPEFEIKMDRNCLELKSPTEGSGNCYYRISKNTYVFLGEKNMLIRKKESLHGWPIIEL